VRFKSFDGLEIPVILYKPKQAVAEKVPALVWINGGPGGQSRKGYSAVIQYLVIMVTLFLKLINEAQMVMEKPFIT